MNTAIMQADAAVGATAPAVLQDFVDRHSISKYTVDNGRTTYGSRTSAYDLEIVSGSAGVEMVGFYGRDTGYEARMYNGKIVWGSRVNRTKLAMEFRQLAKALLTGEGA